MLLFPGEAVFLSGGPAINFSACPIWAARRGLLICEGRCDRSLRPLACRIFPLAPHVDENGVVTAVPDPRARPCAAGRRQLSGQALPPQGVRGFELLAQNPKNAGTLCEGYLRRSMSWPGFIDAWGGVKEVRRPRPWSSAPNLNRCAVDACGRRARIWLRPKPFRAIECPKNPQCSMIEALLLCFGFAIPSDTLHGAKNPIRRWYSAGLAVMFVGARIARSPLPPLRG
jgi:hypothetical protein